MSLTSSLPQLKVKPPPPTWQRGLWITLALIPVVAIFAFAVLQPVKVRPRMGLAPGYAFTDSAGNRLTNEDMRGRLVFYDFTYTGCTAPCPQTGSAMREIQQLAARVDTAGLPVEFVTMSFDPDRDTPAQLQAHAAQLAANPENWRFVTGEPARLKNVIGGGFSVYYQPDEKGSFKFDPTIVLVDGNGIIRGEYKGGTVDLADVERDLGLLVNEIRNSEGAGKLVYEAAHLFLCYPK
jgi:protein SCO1